MKRSFLLLCTVLLVLGCALPCAAYRLARMALVVQGTAPSAAEAASVTSEESSRVAPSPADTADTVCFTDQSTGQTITLPLREYLIGAVAAEMPVSWPDEALKAQAIAAHSYALYCRDHAQDPAAGWLTADPARRQGYLTDAVLRSYWGTAYEANYARLSALVDSVLTQVLYYEDAPAGTSYFAISNGQTEASENVWGSALPYLVSVDSSTDLAADNYEYTVTFSAAQVQQALAGLGLTADLAAPESWFGPAEQLPIQLLWVVIAVPVTAFGCSLYQTADLGVAPYDSLALALQDHLHKPYFGCRVFTDALCAAITFLLGGLVGIGTLVCAFGLGPFIQFFNGAFSEKILQYKPVETS